MRVAASYKTLPPINEVDIPLPTSTTPLPPTTVKLDVLHRDVGANAKTLSFTGVGGRRMVLGADKNAPRGLLTTSTLAPKPRRKNVENYRGRRQ